MSISIKKVTLAEQHSKQNGSMINNNNLSFLDNIEVQCTIRIGTLNLSIAQLRELKSGQVLSLTEKTHEPVDIVLNNQVIARGELMSYEEQFAVQITEVNS